MDIGVSILIPLYNGVEYLQESVSSVLGQTHKKWQLIIGINGHNDVFTLEVQEIIQKLNHEKSDILVKNYYTTGKSNTLNAMVADCKYDIIALLDVDDYWVTDKLECQIPYILEYDVVGGRCEYFGDKQGSPNIPLGDFSHTHNIFHYNPIINSSVMIHKKDAIWDDPDYVQPVTGLDDYSMWFKLFYLKRKFYNMDKVLCYHRIDEKSAFNPMNNSNVEMLNYAWFVYYSSSYKRNIYMHHSIYENHNNGGKPSRIYRITIPYT
jgi:glycosyltransferase involved in cell wall biosynthesis